VNQSAEAIATLDANLVLLVRRHHRGTRRVRRLEAQGSVRPVTIVMGDKVRQDVLEMFFVQDQQPVKTL
jgi:hypothetical protein